MAETKKKVATKKTVAKKVTKKKSTKKILTFNKYSVWFQAISFLLVVIALTLNICNCIQMDLTLDFFGLSVIFLAFSLFPKKGSL